MSIGIRGSGEEFEDKQVEEAEKDEKEAEKREAERSVEDIKDGTY